ncbi:hypothetical protein GCM10027258_92930 [Amycolatopsis stemonae]
MTQETGSEVPASAASHTSPVPSTPRTPPPRSRKLGGKDRREAAATALASLVEVPDAGNTPPPFVPFTPPSVPVEAEEEGLREPEADDAEVDETEDKSAEAPATDSDAGVANEHSEPPMDSSSVEFRETEVKKAVPPASGTPKKGSKKAKKDSLPEDTFVDEPTYPTSVYVLPEARAEAKRLSSKTGQVHASIAMDAIDEAIRADLLGHLIKERQTVPREADSRFPNRRATRRARPRAGGRETRTSSTRVLWQCHFTAGELGVIDDLIKETRATSLSELLSAATEWYVLKYLNADAEAPAEPLDLDRRH